MRRLLNNQNIDNSDPSNYPDGRIKNDTGTGDGTPINENVYGDLHQTVSKITRLYGITPNALPDNETNGFQILDGIRGLASKNDFVLDLTVSDGVLQVPIKLDYMLPNEQVICKSNFAIGMQTQIKGITPVLFNISKVGDFLANEYVRLIKTQTSIVLIRMFDASNVGNLVARLADLEAKVSNVDEKLAVFRQGGAIIPWGRPANTIPEGWQEVVDLRGRTIIGMDVTQTEFAVLGHPGGAKSVTLTKENMPNYNLTRGVGLETPAAGTQNIWSNAPGTAFTETINSGGSDEPFSILNPYKIVHFIEYIN